MSAPHCPKCGNARDELWAYCPGCHFNASFVVGEGWRASMPWEPTVRRELAEQALVMRARGSYVRASRYDGSPFADWPALEVTMAAVSAGYVWLGTHPIRLPGEDEQP